MRIVNLIVIVVLMRMARLLVKLADFPKIIGLDVRGMIVEALFRTD